MKKFLNSLIVFTLVILSACKKSQTEPQNINDEEAIKNMVETSDFFNEFDGFSDWDPIQPFSDTLSDYLVHWGREIKDIVKDINIHIEGDSALVTVNKDVTGILHIIATGSDTFFNLTKPIHHQFTRYALFKRLPEGERKWELVKISDGESHSLDTFTVKIDSVKVEVPSRNFVKVYKDPLEMRKKEDIISLSPGDSVIVTYYTNGVNSLAVLHPRPFARRILRPLGNGIFQGRYHAPLRPGVYHVVFDVLRWESIMTESYPYEDSHVWFFVYKVE